MLRFLFKPRVAVLSASARSIVIRNFSNHAPIDMLAWKTMSQTERMNLAITDSNPTVAEIAYYKGLGLKKLGLDFSNEAISSFNKAMELDEDYKALSEKAIATIYKDLGLLDKAFNSMDKAFNNVVESPNNLNKVKEIKKSSLDLNIKEVIRTLRK
jgi:tetratricopeptide (TPR) repeat protein